MLQRKVQRIFILRVATKNILKITNKRYNFFITAIILLWCIEERSEGFEIISVFSRNPGCTGTDIRNATKELWEEAEGKETSCERLGPFL